MSKVWYTGLGSRETPEEILTMMREIARWLFEQDVWLRTGNITKADIAFGNTALGRGMTYYANDATEAAIQMAKSLHPTWEYCVNPYVQQLHGRSAVLVLGKNLDSPSRFLVCWTPDGCTTHSERTRYTGGTGTAISIADVFGVPVFNLELREHRESIYALITERLGAGA